MNNTIKNSVQLVGHVGKDIKLISFENGNKKASFIMATNEYYTNAKGEKVKQTDWHHLVAWGKTAEDMSAALSKGSEIAVYGKINNRTYMDKEGNNKYITEIVVNEFLKIAKAQPVAVEAVPF